MVTPDHKEANPYMSAVSNWLMLSTSTSTIYILVLYAQQGQAYPYLYWAATEIL